MRRGKWRRARRGAWAGASRHFFFPTDRTIEAVYGENDLKNKKALY